MNLKKIGFALVIATVSGMFFISNAAAATGFCACTPFKIGPAGANVQLQVKNCVSGTAICDPSNGGDGWLRLNSVGTDQQMAAILTAMSLGKAVSIGYDTTKTSGGYVIADSVLFINK